MFWIKSISLESRSFGIAGLASQLGCQELNRDLLLSVDNFKELHWVFDIEWESTGDHAVQRHA